MNRKISTLLACLFIMSAAASFSYEQVFSQEETLPEDVLFQDDFEKGNVNGWALGDEWSIVEEDGNHVLNMRGVVSQAIGYRYWIDYAFQSNVKIVQDSLLMLFRVNMQLKGSYMIRIGLDHVNLNREVRGRGDALADADITLQPNKWYTIRIEGRRNNIKIFIDDELTIDYTDGSESAILYGNIGFETFQSSYIQIDDVLVIDLHGAPICNVQEGEPTVQYGYILEAEKAVGQWQTGPLQIGEPEYLGQPMKVFVNAAYTNQLCPDAVSSVKFHVPKTGHYYIFGKIRGVEKVWGEQETFLVGLYDSDGEHIPNLIDIEYETNFLGNLGRWYLHEGNVTLTYKAKTDHLIVVDYFLLLPEMKADKRTIVILPLYAWSADGEWEVGHSIAEQEEALSTDTSNATSWIDFTIPFQGNYSIYIELWYSSPTSLAFELGNVENLVRFETPLKGEESFWTIMKIGDFTFEKGDAVVKFTSGDLDSFGVIEIESFLIFSNEMPMNEAPIADFTYILDTPANLNYEQFNYVQFIDQSVDPDGTITAWLWYFGDGAHSAEQNPSHSFTEPGTYTVTLHVTDDDGVSSEVSKSIEVRPDPPPTTALKEAESISPLSEVFYAAILLVVVMSILAVYLALRKRNTPRISF
ncbi:MAG: PKD domain-containing protein [Nitrososphaerales archaeon]